jgi:hypothetical protein
MEYAFTGGRMTAEDLTGDGITDLIEYANRQLIVLPGDGDGTFGEPVLSSIRTDSWRYELEDLDADGLLDFVVVTSSAGSIRLEPYLNTGDGTMVAAKTTRIRRASDFRFAHLNNDAYPDLITSDNGYFQTFLGSGDGTFSDVVEELSFASYTQLKAIADLNQDGDADLVLARWEEPSTRILQGVGDGSFTETFALDEYSNNVRVIDVTEDDLPDLINYGAGNNGDLIKIWRNEGDGTFSLAHEFAIGRGIQAIAHEDLDRDGYFDLVGVVADFSSPGGGLVHLAGEATGGFADPTMMLFAPGGFLAGEFLAPGASAVRYEDVDQDGDVDVVAAGWRGFAVVQNQASQRWPRGDVNHDTQVDGDDLGALCTILVHGIPNPSAFDLNADQQLNFADVQVLVQDLLGTTFGDANLDRHFNSTDLLTVFQAGTYENPDAFDVGWAGGDWNCDGRFTSRDLLVAFQAGGYETGEAVASTRLMAYAALVLREGFDEEARGRV